jgi:flavin-dependent dehydrogenase
MEYSVLVIGGGPAGSAVAAVLARKNISVLVVDDLGHRKGFKVYNNEKQKNKKKNRT